MKSRATSRWASLAAISMLLGCGPAASQPDFFAGKQISLLIGTTPGGGYDAYAPRAGAPSRPPHPGQSGDRRQEHAGRRRACARQPPLQPRAQGRDRDRDRAERAAVREAVLHAVAGRQQRAVRFDEIRLDRQHDADRVRDGDLAHVAGEDAAGRDGEGGHPRRQHAPAPTATCWRCSATTSWARNSRSCTAMRARPRSISRSRMARSRARPARTGPRSPRRGRNGSSDKKINILVQMGMKPHRRHRGRADGDRSGEDAGGPPGDGGRVRQIRHVAPVHGAARAAAPSGSHRCAAPSTRR